MYILDTSYRWRNSVFILGIILSIDLFSVFQILCDFQSLQILYFHGNHVEDIREVDKLSGLPKLTKLSLHGNPIEKAKVPVSAQIACYHQIHLWGVLYMYFKTGMSKWFFCVPG